MTTFATACGSMFTRIAEQSRGDKLGERHSLALAGAGTRRLAVLAKKEFKKPRAGLRGSKVDHRVFWSNAKGKAVPVPPYAGWPSYLANAKNPTCPKSA